MLNFLKSKIASMLLGSLIITLGLAVVRLYHQKSELTKSVRNVETKVEEVKKKNQYLEKLSAYFKSEAYLEKEARAKLNYKKADEEVAFVYKDTTKKANNQHLTPNDRSLPFWEKWLRYLAGVVQR